MEATTANVLDLIMRGSCVKVRFKDAFAKYEVLITDIMNCRALREPEKLIQDVIAGACPSRCTWRPQ